MHKLDFVNMLILRSVRLFLLISLLPLGVILILINMTIESISRRPSPILRIAQFWYRLLLWIMNVRVTRLGEYHHQGALVCANHISWLDIPVLGSQIPTYFLSKAELRRLPILGWLAHHAGTLFIQRGGGQITEVKELIQTYLSQDHCLTFFPEATTGNGYALRQFHPRLFASAIESEAPLLPVALQYQTVRQPQLNIDFGDETMAQNLWRVLGRWRTDVTVTLLPIMETSKVERKVLADAAMHRIADTLNLPAERRGLNFRGPLPSAPLPTQKPSSH